MITREEVLEVSQVVYYLVDMVDEHLFDLVDKLKVEGVSEEAEQFVREAFEGSEVISADTILSAARGD